ncbi:carbohydrate sulfotransferase 5-like [Dendronephthya gigantea]|uniref:carbohydrate sulfotransferase 5-like n=1 Tax=Dendronephthya gigantea TaxID=151771 RepID=UPI00106961B1|nr:carbohydrate sulfotransferase 5-like [Dendronephthya gigantea]
MRRKLRFGLVLLLASGIYIFFQFSLKEKSTILKNKIYYSVSGFRQDLSVFFPVFTRTRSPKYIRTRNVRTVYPSSEEATEEPQQAETNKPAQTSHPSYSSTETFSHPPIISKKERPDLWQKLSKEFRNGDETTEFKTTSGVRVIIVAHGRSGSSFFGGIFNSHPDFFFVYEPLRQLKNIVDQSSDSYLENVDYVVNAVLNCQFKDDMFLKSQSRKFLWRAASRSLVSPPFCKTTYDEATNFVANRNWSLCNEGISAEVLNNICRKHVNVASKILLERIEPADLSWLLSVSSLNITSVLSSSMGLQPTVQVPRIPWNGRVYVLYLVRDPRAMIYSRYHLGWVAPRDRREFALESGEADEVVKNLCNTIELSLGEVLLNPDRIKLVRYEELATDPEGLVRHLFRELHISPSKEVFKWIRSKTSEPVKRALVSLSRNATLAINSWRKKIPKQLLKIVETRCSRIMKYLGYIPTNGSESILGDMTKPLYLNKIRDLKENYKWPSFLNHSVIKW